MNSLSKPLCVLVVLLCLVGVCQTLCAQDDSRTLLQDHAVPPIVSPPIYFFLNYSGTITQTTAAGQTTTGTFHSAVNGNQRLDLTTTINGVTTNYVGKLRRAANLVRADGGGAGYLIPVDAEYHRVQGAAKIPVIVERGIIQGGTLDEAGASLVFRGTMDSLQPAAATIVGTK